MKFLLFIFLFIFNLQVTGKSHSPSTDLKPQTTGKSHSPSTDLKSQAIGENHSSPTNLKTPKDCSKKGVERFPVKNYDLSFTNIFSTKNFLDEILQTTIDHILKKKSKKCPVNCKQKNNFKFFISIEPTSVTKNSCPLKESKEQYKFEKKFKNRRKKNHQKSMLKTGNKMNEWILSTFVYPYFPISFKTSSKEYKQTLKTACPACSFYLNYEYTYTRKNQIDMKINVKCGDMRTFLSSDVKSVLTAKNYWECL